MSKSTAKGHRKKSAAPPARRTNDAAIYGGFLLIGAFVTFQVALLSAGTLWREVALGYLMALAVLVNLYTWQAWQGKRLARWQQSLARLPLRFAGYGTRGGQPLEAAHGSRRAMMVLLVSIATSMVLIVGLTLLLIRE